MKKTVAASELSSLRMAAGNERKYSRVIDHGKVKCWVGIGWVNEGDPTPEQELLLPHVIHFTNTEPS